MSAKWQSDEDEILISMTEGGCGDKEISEVLGRSTQAVRSRRRSLGVLKLGKLSPRSSYIYAMYRGDDLIAGGTLKEISEKVGISISTVEWYDWLTRKGKAKNTIVIRIE